MRLIRQCIENRTRHTELFGRRGTPHGPAAAYPIMTVRQAFGDFADAPNLSATFMQNANLIISAARNPASRNHRVCHDHVSAAIQAATERTPPADVIRRNLYYWRTKKKGGPGVAAAYLVETVQGNTFWAQDIPE